VFVFRISSAIKLQVARISEKSVCIYRSISPNVTEARNFNHCITVYIYIYVAKTKHYKSPLRNINITQISKPCAGFKFVSLMTRKCSSIFVSEEVTLFTFENLN